MVHSVISVPFHGSTLYIVKHHGKPYVPMKPIVDGMGMNWQGLRTKLKGRFGSHIKIFSIQPPSNKKPTPLICLSLNQLADWMQTIFPGKVKPKIRARVVQYQYECSEFLCEHWELNKSQSNATEQLTPLQKAVNRIMSKYGLPYQSIYKLIHHRFGTKKLSELTPHQNTEAVDYLLAKVINGEFSNKLESKAAITPEFDFQMYVHNANVACIHIDFIHKAWREELYPALKSLESPLAVKLYDRIMDAGAIIHGVRGGLERASGLKGLQH
ncbi:phage antirepressor N-terminal domain-containing protein [Serratia proteamaculans]|uniref:phage antirepressor N-terminal domain-containing protein n=1 Tax=Serratia proteamaculans TaxID=28151 RepID=UPI002178456A|nr:phage antirepressor N-terminal domain-containing protein [Serratia proteamaculans]CAI1780296.1 P22_AR N-terminal domain [Serratia proteamaculans]